MKKIFSIALVLAVLTTMCFGSVAFADPGDEVHTAWEFNGPGSITINNQATNVGERPSEDTSHLSVSTTGSYSSGWENVSVSPYGSYGGTTFAVERYAEVDNGTISGHFVGNTIYRGWNTECGADLTTDGSGSLYQSFSNNIYVTVFDSHVVADCSYDMSAGGQSSDSRGDSWNFGIGAEGDGSGVLNFNFTEYMLSAYSFTTYSSGHSQMSGNFFVDANSSAGFNANWTTLADFNGYVLTPGNIQNFNVSVNVPVPVWGTESHHPNDYKWLIAAPTPAPGSYGKNVSASWVTIGGFIDGMR